MGLVTTSIDKSVRFWGIDSGEMLKVFTASSPVPVATFLPFNPQVFVAANSNAVLRLVNVQNGMVLQNLKVETEVRGTRVMKQNRREGDVTTELRPVQELQ